MFLWVFCALWELRILFSAEGHRKLVWVELDSLPLLGESQLGILTLVE